MKREWKVKKKVSDDLINQLLANRNIKEEEREIFLNPDWDRDVNDPFLFSQMEESVKIIFESIKNGENIVIHGDYDADGITGSTLLFVVLEKIIQELETENESPASLDVFLPDREKDGYGVAKHTIDRFIKEKVDLLITVDCGIANADALDMAHNAGIKVIICDHHQLAPQLPKYATIIHPLAPNEKYPNKKLCGAGVAFKLATALILRGEKFAVNFVKGEEKWLMDLVAIATVTDVMPLIGENRALEKFGLKVLNRTRRIGLQKIIELSRTKLGEIDTQSIGYRIGPRINASGRIGSAKIAFQALVAKTEEEADDFANQLEMLNRERQRITTITYNEAKKIVEENKEDEVYVVWKDTWLPGIVGLIAGKIVTEFGKPAFALTKVNNQFVGSGRSINGLHLVEGMKSCGDIFVKAGGHPEACGLTIDKIENVELFKDRINSFATTFFADTNKTKLLDIDAELLFENVNFNLFEKLQKFKPFGKDNPEPIFSSVGTILKADGVGKTGAHLKITLTNREGVNQLIGFGFGKLAEQLEAGTEVDVAYKISINEWNGNVALQGQIVDIVIK